MKGGLRGNAASPGESLKLEIPDLHREAPGDAEADVKMRRVLDRQETAAREREPPGPAVPGPDPGDKAPVGLPQGKMKGLSGPERFAKGRPPEGAGGVQPPSVAALLRQGIRMPGDHPEPAGVFIINQGTVPADGKEIPKAASVPGGSRCIRNKEAEAGLPPGNRVGIHNGKGP